MGYQPYPPDPRNESYQRRYNEQANSPYNEDTLQSAEYGDAAYSRRQRESYQDAQGNRVENVQQYVENPNQKRANMRYWITSLVYFLLGVLEIILLLRFIFRLLGANPYNSFIILLYSLSGIFVGPFNGIFNDQTLGRGGSVFELSTIVAMVVYALIGWGLVSLARVIFAPTAPGMQSYSTTRRRRY